MLAGIVFFAVTEATRGRGARPSPERGSTDVEKSACVTVHPTHGALLASPRGAVESVAGRTMGPAIFSQAVGCIVDVDAVQPFVPRPYE
jgi:hypothetical protein